MLAHRSILDAPRRAALALYSATTLSLVVALAEIGTANGLMNASEAVPLVGGAMLTVMLFPIIAMRLAGQSDIQATAHLDDRDGL